MPVLNALRHQWNPHVTVTRRISAGVAVLNALRHQWNPHTCQRSTARTASSSAQRLAASMESSPGCQAASHIATQKCSTPCGINGILTELPWTFEPCPSAQRLAASMESSPLRLRALIGAGTVLNALRHQWNPHRRPRAICSCRTRCSTPCGINGILTQTLVAPGSTSLRVLNALRHQWNPHGRRAVIMHALACAQRLAASMESSHGPPSSMACCVVCSTPCGINGILTAWVLTCWFIKTCG